MLFCRKGLGLGLSLAVGDTESSFGGSCHFLFLVDYVDVCNGARDKYMNYAGESFMSVSLLNISPAAGKDCGMELRSPQFHSNINARKHILICL